MKRFALASAVAMIAASPVLAGGMVPVEPAPVVVAPVVVAPSTDWTGGYIGISAGAGDIEIDAPVANLEDDFNAIGLFGGYNYDMGQAVVGVELSYDDLDFDEFDYDDASVFRVMLRAGYDGGKVLPYLTAGYAQLDLDDDNDNGFAYGIGVDFKAANSFVVGAQYLQHEFDDFDDSGNDIDAGLFKIRAAYQF